MIDALDRLGVARELVVEIYKMLPKTKRAKVRAQVEHVAGDLFDEEP